MGGIPSKKFSMSSNFKTRFAWFIYAFVKIHGFTLLRSSEDKRVESLGSGFKTASNSSVSSTSRLYAIASKINSRSLCETTNFVVTNKTF